MVGGLGVLCFFWVKVLGILVVIGVCYWVCVVFEAVVKRSFYKFHFLGSISEFIASSIKGPLKKPDNTYLQSIASSSHRKLYHDVIISGKGAMLGDVRW